MPFVKIVKEPHVCKTPNIVDEVIPMGYGIGTIWECSICTSQWQLIRSYGKHYWRLMHIKDYIKHEEQLKD